MAPRVTILDRDTGSLREARVCVREQHHAKAKAFAQGYRPKTITERILSEDPAFKELVSFYEKEFSNFLVERPL